jgi:UrcA family protein
MSMEIERFLAAAAIVGAAAFFPAPAVQAAGNSAGAQLKANNEEVIVIAPRSYIEKGDHGGPVRTISVSGKVAFHDLDLSTPWGRTELKARVRVMASNLCGQLERRYPVGVEGGPSCYEQAVNSGMHLADQVLADSSNDYWKK